MLTPTTPPPTMTTRAWVFMTGLPGLAARFYSSPTQWGRLGGRRGEDCAASRRGETPTLILPHFVGEEIGWWCRKPECSCELFLSMIPSPRSGGCWVGGEGQLDLAESR